MPLPAGLGALAHRDFRLFFAAQLVALTGAWMQTVAQAWLVLQLTGSPLRLGVIGTLQFGPILAFSILSGVVADRLPRRGVLIATQLTLACQALALAVLVGTGVVRYWHVCVLALLLGLATVLDQPARQSLVADLVGKRHVASAVGLNSAGFNAARIVGPALAGILIARAGVVPAFALNGIGFLLVILALLRLPAAPPAPRRPPRPLAAEIAEGLRYALRREEVKLALAVLFVVSFCVFNFTVYVPLLARQVLGLGPEGFGFLMTALGVGAVAGALVAGMAPEPSPGRLVGAAALACTGLLALGLVRDVATAVVVLPVTGFFGLLVVAGCNTALQLAAPDELRGRVMSLYSLVYGGVYPVGAFLVGAISERWDVSRAFLVAGTFGLGSLALVVVWWRRRAAAGG